MRRGKKKYPFKYKAMAILLSCICTFALLEVIVRISFWKSIDNESLESENRRMFIGDIVKTTENLDLHYELRPNLDIVWKDTKVYTDHKGECRIAAPNYKTKKDGVRIAVIGDSTAFGWGVDYEKSYPELLRSKLSQSFSRTVVMRNYSVPGYNSQQYRICLQTKVLKWKPDFVVVHYDHNDTTPTMARPWHIRGDYGDNFLNSALVKLIVRLVAIIQRKNERQKNASDEKCDHYTCSGHHYEQHIRELQTIFRILKKENIPAILVISDINLKYYSDIEQDNHYQILHKRLLQHLQGSDFILCDLYHLWQGIMKQNKWKNMEKFWLRARDFHPNEEGHQRIAEYLHKSIKKQPKILTCFEDQRER